MWFVLQLIFTSGKKFWLIMGDWHKSTEIQRLGLVMFAFELISHFKMCPLRGRWRQLLKLFQLNRSWRSKRIKDSAVMVEWLGSEASILVTDFHYNQSNEATLIVTYSSTNEVTFDWNPILWPLSWISWNTVRGEVGDGCKSMLANDALFILLHQLVKLLFPDHEMSIFKLFF